MQVVGMLKSGRLVQLPTGICASSVAQVLADVVPPAELALRMQALALLCAGRIRAPKPPDGRWSTPASITLLPSLLVPQSHPRRGYMAERRRPAGGQA